MYEDGKRYLRLLGNGVHGRSPRADLEPASNEQVSVADVRTALLFVEAVDGIAEVAGTKRKDLLLSGANIILTPTLIGELCADLCTIGPSKRMASNQIRLAMKAGSKVGAKPKERQRADKLRRNVARLVHALDQAAAGLHPYAQPAPASDPTDLTVWHYYLAELGAAAASLRTEISTARDAAGTAAERADLYRDAAATRVVASAIQIAIASEEVVQREQRHADIGETGRVRAASGRTSHRSIVEGVAHDLALAISQRQPGAEARAALSAATEEVRFLAARLADDCRRAPSSRGRSRPAITSHPLEDGSDATRGTYVFILKLADSAVLRIGRLGTFWLPSGVGVLQKPRLFAEVIARASTAEFGGVRNLDRCAPDRYFNKRKKTGGSAQGRPTNR